MCGSLTTAYVLAFLLHLVRGGRHGDPTLRIIRAISLPGVLAHLGIGIRRGRNGDASPGRILLILAHRPIGPVPVVTCGVARLPFRFCHLVGRVRWFCHRPARSAGHPAVRSAQSALRSSCTSLIAAAMREWAHPFPRSEADLTQQPLICGMSDRLNSGWYPERWLFYPAGWYPPGDRSPAPCLGQWWCGDRRRSCPHRYHSKAGPGGRGVE